MKLGIIFLIMFVCNGGYLLAQNSTVHILDANHFYVDFAKQQPYGAAGCYISSKLGGGQGLHCHIEAPAGASGVIKEVRYDCNPDAQPMPKDSPCRHVYTCPSHGSCVDNCPRTPCPVHLYEYEPHDLNLADTRTLDWWAWTDDSNEAVLRFTIEMRPKKSASLQSPTALGHAGK